MYRLWSIDDRYPAMMRVACGGEAIAVEVWAIPTVSLSTILLQEPPGLCIGKVRLADGEEVLGVLGEAYLCEGRQEITQWGGWRAYQSGQCISLLTIIQASSYNRNKECIAAILTK